MKILIPTAKEMKLSVPSYSFGLDKVETTHIIDTLAKLSPEQLANFYQITPTQAEKQYKAIQKIHKKEAKYYRALDLFNGLMYRQLDRDYTAIEQAYISDYVYITSALYGVINAYDKIAEHRLDFQMKLMIDGKRLKYVWREKYDMALADEDLVISLLSSEFEDVFSKEVRQKIIHIQFMERQGDRLKTHSTISKKARGKYLNACIKQQITMKQDFQAIIVDNFHYQPELSNEMNWVFVKELD